MTSIKQIEANKRNALHSTGPSSDQGKRRSRCNAIRHGLTAETVISQLEDREDYQRFEASVTADYSVETAVERELVLRLASLLWRLRRAMAIETYLFGLNVPNETASLAGDAHVESIDKGAYPKKQIVGLLETAAIERSSDVRYRNVANSFLRLMNLPDSAIDRLNRYEMNLWRRASQIMLMLSVSHHRRRQNIRAFRVDRAV